MRTSRHGVGGVEQPELYVGDLRSFVGSLDDR
jgi:hypothetical protein